MKLLKIFEDFKTRFNLKGKKAYEFTLVVLLIGILLLIAGKDFFKDLNFKKNDVSVIDNSQDNIEGDHEMETKIAKALQNIKGAGKVDVMITYDSGTEKIYAYETRTNQTESRKEESKESDSENKIAYEEDSNGVKRPVLLKEIKPSPKGALVIADGAYNPDVRQNLSKAVEVLLKIPSYKVQVFERKK